MNIFCLGENILPDDAPGASPRLCGAQSRYMLWYPDWNFSLTDWNRMRSPPPPGSGVVQGGFKFSKKVFKRARFSSVSSIFHGEILLSPGFILWSYISKRRPSPGGVSEEMVRFDHFPFLQKNFFSDSQDTLADLRAHASFMTIERCEVFIHRTVRCHRAGENLPFISDFSGDFLTGYFSPDDFPCHGTDPSAVDDEMRGDKECQCQTRPVMDIAHLG